MSLWTDQDAALPFIRRADKVKALLWPVINWFASQTGWGWRMTLRGHGGDEEVTNTVQERRDFTDKNI